jgi:hypothetical protein
MNLEVKVIEKASGLLRFETIQLPPDQMDQYCVYPLVSTGCRRLPTSFTAAAAAYGGGRGMLSITVLVKSTGPESSAIDIRTNGTASLTTRRTTDTYPVESKGVLEEELIKGVRARLAEGK